MVTSWSNEQLDELIEQATVDCYDEEECITGFFTMLEDELELPFRTAVLGVAVEVADIGLTGNSRIVAICVRDQEQQRIALLDLPLPSDLTGAEWVEAYRRWSGWRAQ